MADQHVLPQSSQAFQAMQADGSPPPSLLPPAQGRANMLVQVQVPAGAVPGQRVEFPLPDGRRVTATVQEQVAPGALVTISVPCPTIQSSTINGSTFAVPQNQDHLRAALISPMPPLPGAAVHQSDNQNAQVAWAVYAFSCMAIFCGCGFMSCLSWVVMAALYYCKAPEDRARRPRQRLQAQVSALSAVAVCACCMATFFAMAGLFIACGGEDLSGCPGLKNMINETEHHRPPRPPGPRPHFLAQFQVPPTPPHAVASAADMPPAATMQSAPWLSAVFSPPPPPKPHRLPAEFEDLLTAKQQKTLESVLQIFTRPKQKEEVPQASVDEMKDLQERFEEAALDMPQGALAGFVNAMASMDQKQAPAGNFMI